MPAVCAFNNPAARTSARAGDKRLFPWSTNVRDDASFACFVFWIVVVVALVQTQMPGSPRPSRRFYQNGVQGSADHPLVVNVCSGQGDGERDAAAVGQNMSLAAELGPIGRIGTRELPPLGALTMALSSEAQSQSIPLSWW